MIIPLGLSLPELCLVLFPLLLWYRTRIEPSFVRDDDLAAFLSSDDTCITPGEIIHVPESIERKTEREYWHGKDIYNHPAYHFPFASNYKNNALKTIDCPQ